MSNDRKRIVIPDEDDVAAYGGSGGPAGGASEPPTADDGGAVCDPTADGGSPPSGEGLSDEARRTEEWKDKCLRARAELANYQKRVEKERTEAARYAHSGLVRMLLPVLDDLERVVASGDAHPDNAEALRDGVRLVLDNFLKVLREFEVTRIETDGAMFDPNVHEALMQQPAADREPGAVVQEVSKGYRLHDRVLRPAKVIVAKAVEGGSVA